MTENKFKVENIIACMERVQNIRNMSIIAHVDHGKSTLTDSLLAKAGLLSLDDAGRKLSLDTRKDEIEKGITIKSTGISLHFDLKGKKIPPSAQGSEFVINLIDSPGHVDFSPEVTAALRVTDGALVVVDCVEGCCVQTTTVLRQALTERIKVVLTINKIDRAFLELKQEPEEMYQSFCKTIESVNEIISTHQDDTFGDCRVFPERGTVAFSAGRQGWAFTIPLFARMYSQKLGVSEEKLLEKLWGDWFYDKETKKWQQSPISKTGQKLSRGFCEFILKPIKEIFDASMRNDVDEIERICKKIEVPFTTEVKQKNGKDLIEYVMRRWLPAGDALIEMAVNHLPSPAEAMKYRTEILYTGPQDDETATAIRNCDKNGPLVMYISKHFPTKDNSRFHSFGRIFSGTIQTGQKVRILGPAYEKGKKVDLFEDVSVQRTILMMGKLSMPVSAVPCGNTLALVGIDAYLNKSGTICSHKDSYPLKKMIYSVSPVVRVAVSTQNPSDIPKLIEGFRKLSKSDPLVQCTIDKETGQHIVACSGELHLEITISDLKAFLGNNIPLNVSEPAVSFKESILETSTRCLSKSPNKLNRIFCTAQPISEELALALENGKISDRDDSKHRAKILKDEFNWQADDARKIWCFGPELNPSNILVDSTKGIQFMNEIKESVVTGFEWVTKHGVLAGENLRGVQFNILDCLIHSDSVHRGGGQIIPTARRVFYASQLSAKPCLMEPVFLVEIQTPSSAMGGIHTVLNKRRGRLIEEIQNSNGMNLIKCYLPVIESFGFNQALRAETSGKAFPQCIFDHWEILSSDPLDETSKAHQIVKGIRERKGLPKSIPPLSNFLDKL